MKRLAVLIIMIIILVPSAMALAIDQSHGSSIATNIRSHTISTSNYISTWMTLSNISDSDVECHVRVYGADGDEVYDQVVHAVFAGSLISYNSTVITTSSTFTIPAHGTRSVHFYRPTARDFYGYAIVDWTSDNPNLGQALVGSVTNYRVCATAQGALSSITINSGQPF